MSRKRRYQAVSIGRVDLDALLSEIASGPINIGLDVAKEEIFVVLRDRDWKFSSPYDAKKRRDGGRGRGAVIAVMRKLALAIWAVAVKGAVFELERLFPGIRLSKRRGPSAGGSNARPGQSG